MDSPGKLHGDVSTYILFFVVILIAASNYIVCKWALETVPPLSLMAIRYLLATAIITILIAPKIVQLRKEMLAKSVLTGATLTVAVVCWQLGLYKTDHVGPASFIVSLDGLMVPLFSALLFRDKLPAAVIAAIPFAVVGLGLLSLKKGMSVSIADIWFLLSSFAFSLHILLTHRFSRFFDPMSFAWVQMLVVATICSLAAYCFDRGELTMQRIFIAKYEIIYLAVIATALRFTLQNYAQRKTSAASAGFLFVLEPAMVAILSYLILSEHFSARQLIGSSLIFVAVVFAHSPIKVHRAKSSASARKVVHE